jgi:outer membrane biosynthesis protein TonB
MLVIEKHHSELLQNTSMTINTVFAKYKDFMEDPADQHTLYSIPEADKVALAVPLEDLSKLAIILFVGTWNRRMKSYNDRQKELALEKAATMIMLEKPTSDAAMVLDTEQTAEMKTLGELIDRKVDEKTKSLTATISRLQQQNSRHPKGQREAKQEQASTTKKSSKKQPQKNPKNSKKDTTPTATKDKDDKKKQRKKKSAQNAADGNDSDSSAGKRRNSRSKKNTNERNTNKRSSKSGRK